MTDLSANLTRGADDARASDRIVKLQTAREEPAAGAGPGHAALAGLRIGRILIDMERLRAEEVLRVLEHAKRHQLLFGESALQLGLVQAEDVQFALARQYAFPRVAPGDTKLSEHLIAAFDPDHPAVQQLRALRSQIALRVAPAKRRHPVVAIVSPNAGDGRSFIAANLAVAFAQLGQRTLLVDAALRRPAQHELFKLDPRQGLTAALAGRTDRAPWSSIESLPGLNVMTAGPTPPNPVELIEQVRFARLLDQAGEVFDMTIVDTPAGSEGPGAALIAHRAGAAVLVARVDTTREPEARRFAQELEKARTDVLGLVFNEIR